MFMSFDAQPHRSLEPSTKDPMGFSRIGYFDAALRAIEGPEAGFRSAQEPERFQPVLLQGRCMFADRAEIPCRAELSSPARMTILAESRGAIGSRLVAYLDGLGRVEGEIRHSSPRGLNVEIHAGASKRARLSRRLTWLAAKARGSAIERRLFERDERRSGQRVFATIEGTVFKGEIIDESASGMALAIGRVPPIGALILVDGNLAQVVRRLTNGFAVKYVPATPNTP